MTNSTSNSKLFKKYSLLNSMPSIELSKLPLNGTTFRIYHYLLPLVDFGNEVVLNQTECARELKMSRTQVNSSLKTLIEYGIIRKLPKKFASVCYYQINPSLLYRGTKDKYSQAVNAFYGLDD
jgi:predicted transcriptional regulator